MSAVLVRAGSVADLYALQARFSRSDMMAFFPGTVLSQYTRANEMATPGKALYKVANLEKLTLRAYVTGDQLPALRLNQSVKISVVQTGGETKEYPGKITSISDRAEFTPKSIQTKSERANLVYAVKIEVPNDGFLKIGMYADVSF